MFILLQSGLLIWYFVSLYLVFIDKTISTQLKIMGEMINLLCIGFVATTMFHKTDIHNILYYTVAFILIVWYIYYTPQDWYNPEYTAIEKYGYTAIDLITMLYLFIAILGNDMKISYNLSVI